MAQVGAWVPAHSLTLTPVDAIFVRMGAKDDVMSGQSTFFVELAETAAALNRATPASLVALDELGRGTATSDGAAIAAAVLEHLSAKTCCRSEEFCIAFGCYSVGHLFIDSLTNSHLLIWSLSYRDQLGLSDPTTSLQNQYDEACFPHLALHCGTYGTP